MTVLLLVLLFYPNSVTKFGKFRQFDKSLATFWGFFITCQNFEPILANYSANFHCCKWPNIEQIIHLVSLHPTLSFQQNQFCSSDWPFLGCENDLWVQANSDKKSVKDTTWKCASQRERKWEINLTFNTFNSGTRIGCKADSPKKIIHL